MLWWILGGAYVYLQIGAALGRSRWETLDNHNLNSFLYHFYFPCTSSKSNRTGVCPEMLQLCDKLQSYQVIMALIWPITLFWSFGYWIGKAFFETLNFGLYISYKFLFAVIQLIIQPSRIISFLGSLIIGNFSLSPIICRIRKRLHKLGTKLAIKAGSLHGAYLAAKERRYLQLSPAIDADERQVREYQIAAKRKAELEKQHLAIDAEMEELNRTHPDLNEVDQSLH